MAHAAADALNHNIRHNFYPFLPVLHIGISQNARTERSAGHFAAKNLFLNKTLCTQSLFNLLLVGLARLYQRQTALASFPAQHIHGYFTGMGFTSQNKASASGSISNCNSRAFAVSPSKNALQQLCTSSGLTLDTTLITPLPPRANRGTT